ncbi:MAG: HAD-IC family P-type ATPase [Dehalococcoidia bacterium]
MDAPPALTGLTLAEAADRAARGLVNAVEQRERSDREIIRDNLFTFFNTVLGSLIIVLLILAVVDQDPGTAQDAVFVGLVVAMNVIVGTFQEIRSTRALRKIVALTAPRATVVRDGHDQSVLSSEVVQGDLIHLSPGDQVVADGHIVAERAEIDESLLTGESRSVRKETGDELLSGSFCTAGSCYYTAERVGADAYATRLTADARKLVRRESPLQLRFRRILRVLLIATAFLGALLLIRASVADDIDIADAIKNTTATISSVVPEGLLLGLTVALAVGAVRLSRRGAIVQDINAVEAMNYIDVVCLDKTGTITANKLSLREVHWLPSADALRPWLGAFTAATENESKTATALAEGLAATTNEAQPSQSVPFNSERRWSALRLDRGGESRVFVLGAPETVLPHCDGGGPLQEIYARAAAAGLRGVIFAEAPGLPDPDAGLANLTPLALLTVADVLRPEVTAAFATMNDLGIEPKIISGDNPETVGAIIAQLNIELRGGAIYGAELDPLTDDQFRNAVEEHSIFGRVAPAQKARIVTALRDGGHFVAMVGDGANDVHALRAADVAVAMESGTQTARAVSGIILLNDSFAAFVHATAEAQAVLGNSVQLSKLFITKSFYAFLLIIATQMLSLEFPFLPRHGSLTALFTLGLPSIFIAATKPPTHAGRDFTNSVLRFALPASLALAAATISVALLTEGFLGRAVEDSRTLVSLTIGIVGMYFMVQVIGFDGVSIGSPLRTWRRPILTTVFGLALLGGFILTLYTPWLRSFFDFGSIGVDEWAIVMPAVVAAMVGQYVFSHYWREIIAWIVKQPSEKDVSRGRAV